MKKHTYSNIKSLAIGNLLVIGSILTLVGCNKASEMNSTINQDEDIEAAASQNELLDMLQHGEAIEIEVAVPLNQEDGTAEAISWEQLALLETNETLRKEWDNILGITITETGKNGMLYVNAEGNNENNNTLRVALHNRAFSTLLTDDNSRLELSNAAQGQYADLEADETDKALYMAINGYFNLLPDATPNFSNPDSTLNRLEFMSMVMRAETPVQDITPSTAFADAVGSNDLNIYAQEVAENSYLDLGSKSLNNMTANGTITRGEAVYLLMSRYFSDELASVDISKAALKDVKDGGNIAEKMSAEATSKDYWKSYELSYVLQFPDQGAPTDLYKALVLAEQKGIITSETRFDEGITKAESIELLITALMQEKGIPEFNYKQAKIDDHEVEIKAEPEVEVEPGEVIELYEQSEELEEVDDDLILTPEEALEKGISPYAGKTSKHGYVYPADYIECGPKDEDKIADVERFFDEGWLSEDEYKDELAYWKGIAAEKQQPTANPMEQAAQSLLDDYRENNPGSGSTSGNNNGGSSTPATGPSDMEFPEGPSYEKTGRLCY